MKKGSLLLVLLLLCGCAIRSENEGALEYKNGKCVVFYPGNNAEIEEYAKSLCASGEELIFDYEYEERNNVRIVSYVGSRYFYINDDGSPLKLKVVNETEMLRDLLRYQMKKDDIDYAYTADFIDETEMENFDVADTECTLTDEGVIIRFPQYDYDLLLPFEYAQTIVGKDFGHENRHFEKQTYINPKRPMIALTFDDGPYWPVDSQIYEILQKYDSRATFFFVGDRLGSKQLEDMRYGISLDMEYGSHTENHQDLARYSPSDAKYYVTLVADYVEEKTGYKMKLYRPPYGSRNYDMEDILELKTVLWNVDTRDWANRDEEITYSRVVNSVKDGSVVLMHSLYPSSAKATIRLVPELLNQGFQLVTVSEMMTLKNIDSKVFPRSAY